MSTPLIKKKGNLFQIRSFIFFSTILFAWCGLERHTYSHPLSLPDLQKVAQAIQEFQARILHDVDAAKLRDSLNLALLQMQTYWKVG